VDSPVSVLHRTRDTRFLPERFRKLSLAQVNATIEQLKTSIGE